MLTRDANVLIVYKNFAKPNSGISHIGLGVAALNNAKVLRAAGVRCDVESIFSTGDLQTLLAATPRTHVVISAPWIDTATLSKVVKTYSNTQFFVVSHSNVGFLQADSNGVALFKEGMELEAGTFNFRVAGNSDKFCRAVKTMFGKPCALLPNCYYLDGHTPPARHPDTGTIRIGAFGAVRPLKNFMTAAGAALGVARATRRPVEFTMSSGRAEGGGDTTARAVMQLLKNEPGVTLMQNGWTSWDLFRNTVGHQHLLLQPSYTESFNMVTADGIAKGVPSVVSEAIDWVPKRWQSHFDDVSSMTVDCLHVLHSPDEARQGLRHLVAHNELGLQAWGDALGLDDLLRYRVPVVF